MSFARRVPTRTLSALDFGPDTVVALIAEKKFDGSLRIIGGGHSKSQGAHAGEITHLGDAAEAVIEACRRAERAAGLRIRTLYYNLFAPNLTSVDARGSKILSGQGQVQRADVAAARSTALRMTENFERKIIYAGETDFIIDEKDRVADPVGVFGQKLEVFLHAVLVGAAQEQTWQDLMRRASIAKSVPLFSLWSVCCGLLSRDERMLPRVVVESRSDGLSAGYLEGGVLRRSVGCGNVSEAPPLVRELAGNGAREILVSGPAADEAVRVFTESGSGVPVLLKMPRGIPKLDQPSYAAVAGLLRAADESERSAPVKQRAEGMVSHLRSRATQLINDYF